MSAYRTARLRIGDVPVALLAGGLATRLGAISEATPKALVEVNGRPFIDHQLELLHRHGVRKIVMCVGHLGDQIERLLGDGASLAMHIRYSYDGPNLVGTGGALRRALPLLGDAFWVMYGDSYMDIDYPAVLAHFSRSEALGLMSVIRNDDQWDRSNAIFERSQLTAYDKRHFRMEMRHIDYGVQLLRREAALRLPVEGKSDLADLYHELVNEGRIIGHEVFNRFYEIGTPASLEEARRYLAIASTLKLSA